MSIGWVSSSAWLQGTSVVMSVFIFNGTSGRVIKGMGSVDRSTHTQQDWVDNNLGTLKYFAQFTMLFGGL
eukprot:1144678-Pelagomonas_calceolata.AAC.1